MYHMTLVELSCLCLSTSAPFQNSNEKMTNSGHAVVVWEYESRGGNWLAYQPAVSGHLERAHSKKLTRVLLSDADPGNQFYVNIKNMTQCSEDAEVTFINVRRKFYTPASPAGKGCKWEWAGQNSEWHTYNMEVQCIVEEAWARGDQIIDLSKTYLKLLYSINFCNLTQIRQPNGPVRNIRRMQQAPYPLVKISPTNIPSTPVIMSGRKQQQLPALPPNIPPKPNQLKLVKCSPPSSVLNSNASSSNNTSSTKRQTKVLKVKQSEQQLTTPTNLARQILNNLNIFSHKQPTITNAAIVNSRDNPLQTHSLTSMPSINSNQSRSRCKYSRDESLLDLDSSSMNSGRRPSVDTVSTYLSQESKESGSRKNLNFGSISDLLDCSIGSDDVFVASNTASTASLSGAIVGVDPASDMISRFVYVVGEPSAPQWHQNQPCPMCMNELKYNAQNPTVSLSRCQHLMHLNCLNELIISQQKDSQKNLFIECPICLTVYGEKTGIQPPGSMSWIVIPKSLPGHEGQNTIQIVYNIVSGIQGPEHPHPGRAFFAVGFPRTCFLPDCSLGRKVLRFLKIAFDRRLLFLIGRSATTGVEDVVLWNSVEHKTQFSMYPDPGYLQRCMQHLVHLGVTD